jgi:predicted transposase YbfD/YdcC
MTTFIPKKITAKASKAGKTYWEIETEQGNATCFDYPIVQEIEKNLGKPISLYDLEKNDKGFINIRPAKHQQEEKKPTKVEGVKSDDDFAEARKLKDQSIYTSYAKDIFIKLLEMPKATKEDSTTTEALMKEAIALVKQAREAFN